MSKTKPLPKESVPETRPLNYLQFWQIGLRRKFDVATVTVPKHALLPEHIPDNIDFNEYSSGSMNIDDAPLEMYPGVPIITELIIREFHSKNWWKFSLPRGVKPYWTGEICYSLYGNCPSEHWRLLHFLEAYSFAVHYPSEKVQIAFHCPGTTDDIGYVCKFPSGIWVLRAPQPQLTKSAYVRGSSNYAIDVQQICF